ncbi:MBL fold metallo-hydrolase [Methanoregula sp. PtaB.Bin085]|uniref:MBL fold metallo-hydrolase n=1 Tax=Methanoregula sp. PtaB.Bin085 TaxID=1811680 RepID=UPI0009D3CB60|nr:lamin tail domain-containing protein [Methanoregula sp. PtaB.Bin085]OPX62979.1 MAG: ComEC family competence protein [Methanoregula sp. PtaB.Bin085]
MSLQKAGRALLPVILVILLIATPLLAGCSDILPPDPGTSLRTNTSGDLRVYFLDVGQGDSSVILFQDKVILIDAGEVDYGNRVVSDLENLGVTRINLLVATHPHSDHIGGMQKVLTRFPVGKVLDSGIPSSSSLYGQFLRTVDEKHIPYITPKRGQTIDIDPSLRIVVLSPPEQQIGDSINTNSVVLRVSYGTVNLLFAGDATTEAEDVMIRSGLPLDADVLKVSHHGSSDASSAAFLRRVDPEVAVISLGRDNDYGHPHRETLGGLDSIGALVLRTDRDGTVCVESDGATYSIATERDTVDIWSHSRMPSATPATTTSPGSLTPAGTATPGIPFTLPVTFPSNLTIPTVPSNLSILNLTLPSLQLGNASNISISAVQFDAPGDDTKNLNGEWIRLTNNGEETVLLTSWTLADRSGTEPYRFPAFLLMPKSSVTVYTGDGVMNDTALFMGRKEPLWGNSGDRATLMDGSGRIIDQWPETVTT